MKLEEIYTSGEYFEKYPDWHAEESPWKAGQIMRMIGRSGIKPRSVCEVGCGAGEVLKQLQAVMDPDCSFWGYEISPQALSLADSRINERLRFKFADLRQEQDAFFDLLLMIDVIEHVEDCYGFLRDLRSKGGYKIMHLPLELSVQSVLRNGPLGVRKAFRHAHFFTKDLALEMLKDAGYQVLDYFYTPRAIDIANNPLKKLIKAPRIVLFSLHRDLAVRVLGGYSLLVLAK